MDKYTKYALNRLDELELKYNQTIERVKSYDRVTHRRRH